MDKKCKEIEHKQKIANLEEDELAEVTVETNLDQLWCYLAIKGINGSEWARYSEPILFNEPELHYPDTIVRIYQGEFEFNPFIIETGTLYFNRIQSKHKSLQTIKNTGHKVYSTCEGAKAMVAAVLEASDRLSKRCEEVPCKEDDLLVTVDCGGIRRMSLSQGGSSRWKVDRLPVGPINYDSISSIVSTRINGRIYGFAGSKTGRLYRWNRRSGWTLIWEDDDNREISSLYIDPRPSFNDVLYVGTGSVDMRHNFLGKATHKAS